MVCFLIIIIKCISACCCFFILDIVNCWLLLSVRHISIGLRSIWYILNRIYRMVWSILRELSISNNTQQAIRNNGFRPFQFFFLLLFACEMLVFLTCDVCCATQITYKIAIITYFATNEDIALKKTNLFIPITIKNYRIEYVHV